jgi:hypothetical protein
MGLGEKLRRGAPVFGFAWDLDEDMLFHGGRSREEKRSIIEHEKKRAAQMRQMHQSELSGGAAGGSLPGQINQTPPLAPSRTPSGGATVSSLPPRQQLEGAAAGQASSDIVYRTIPGTAPMPAPGVTAGEGLDRDHAQPKFEPHPLMDSRDMDEDSYVVLELERRMWEASEADLELTRSRNADEADTAEMENGVSCAICLEGMKLATSVSLQCGHCFHRACAQKSEKHAMLEKGHYECPECRESVSFVRAVLFTKDEEIVRLETAPTKRTDTHMSAGVTPIDAEAGAKEDAEESASAELPSGPVRAKYAVIANGHEPGKKSGEQKDGEGEGDGEGGVDGADGEHDREAENPQGLVRLLKTNLAMKELLNEMLNVGADGFEVAQQGKLLTAWNAEQLKTSNAALAAEMQPATLTRNAATIEQRMRWKPATVRRTITVWEVKCKELELTTMAVANELYEEELKLAQKRRRYKVGFCVMIIVKVLVLTIFIISQTAYADDGEDEDFFGGVLGTPPPKK